MYCYGGDVFAPVFAAAAQRIFLCLVDVRIVPFFVPGGDSLAIFCDADEC